MQQVDPDYQKVNSSGPCRKNCMGNRLTPARFDVTCGTPKKACSTFDNHQRRVSYSQIVGRRTCSFNACSPPEKIVVDQGVRSSNRVFPLCCSHSRDIVLHGLPKTLGRRVP